MPDLILSQLTANLTPKESALQSANKLLSNAVDLARAIIMEDGTYIRADLTRIATLRDETLQCIYEWNAQLLDL